MSLRSAKPAGWPVLPVTHRISSSMSAWHATGHIPICSRFGAFIAAGVLRASCSQRNRTTQCETPWSRSGMGLGLSALMEARVTALCQGLPVARVAHLLGVSGDRAGRVLEHCVPKARYAELMALLSNMLTVDNTCSRRGAVLSVLLDAEPCAPMCATPRRKHAACRMFAGDLRERSGTPDAGAEISLGMPKAGQAGARAHGLQMQSSHWARRSRLLACKREGQPLKDRLVGIPGDFRSRLSNGYLESTKRPIQAAKARARGYRIDRCLSLTAYIVCGTLKPLRSNSGPAAAIKPA